MPITEYDPGSRGYKDFVNLARELMGHRPVDNVEPNELTIEYLEYDDDYLAVRRDGLTLFLIKRDRVDSMINSLNEYRAGTFVAK